MPPAASRYRAAFVASVVWSVTSFSRSVSTSWASGNGAVTSKSGSLREDDPALGHRPDVAVEPQASEGVDGGASKPNATQVIEVLLLERERLQAIEASSRPAATRNPRFGGSRRTYRLKVAGSVMPRRR